EPPRAAAGRPRLDGTGWPDAARPSFDAAAYLELGTQRAYDPQAHAVADRLVEAALPRLRVVADPEDQPFLAKTFGVAARIGVGIAVVAALAARGWRPGVVASGYGAQRTDARLVNPDDDAQDAGDEALLLAQLTGRPVAAARRRAEAVAALLATHPDVDVIVSDDGLQHAGLARTVEIAVFDRRGIGNGRLLPAGPLREPLAHLAGMDAIAINGDDGQALARWRGAALAPVARSAGAAPGKLPPVFRFDVVPLRFLRVDGHGDPLAPEEFRALVQRSPAPEGSAASPPRCAPVSLTAVAGIGEPQRLFDTLAHLGLPPALRVAPGDHRALDAATLVALPGRFVVMTTKDAVKCRAFADSRCWALEVSAQPEPGFIDWLEHELREATRRGLPPA
ncbi:MAG: tetraacyldisaccharide 4'-kinase, partial [Gammaproteobacteria bacterium]